MYTKDDIDERVFETSKKSHGLHVYNRLKKVLKEGSEKHQSRWFWELLQNAKDAVEDSETVSIKVEISDERVRFSHTGNPFKLDEIVQLIVQGSTKSERDDKTGRFGTGFISTYVLSQKVRIEGVLDDDTKFDFYLDREAKDEEEFLKKQEDCIKEFHESFNEIDPSFLNEFKTVYTYRLTESQRGVARNGMDQIEKYLPFAIAFNQKIDEISIIVDKKVLRVSKTIQNHQKLNGQDIQRVEISMNDNEVKRSFVIGLITETESEWDAAILLEQIDDSLYVVDLTNDYPKLYFAFPLLGTGKYGFPIVINSEKFTLEPEREYIYLGKNEQEDPEIERNKRIVKSALQHIPFFIEWSKHLEAKNLIYLFNFKPFSENGLDDYWLDQLKLEAINSIENIPAFYDKEALISFADFLITAEKESEVRRRFYNLLRDLDGVHIPIQNEQETWYHILLNHSFLKNKEILELDNAYGLVKLALRVQEMERLEALQNNFSFETEDRTLFNWLNEFYLLVNQFKPHQFEKKAILLNQNNRFVKKNSEIKIDKIHDSILLEVDILLGEDIKSKLIHPQIKLPDQVCNPVERQEYIDNLIAKLNNKPEDQYSEEAIKANSLLLKWLLDHNDYERIKVLQIIASRKDDSYKKEALSIGARQRHLSPIMAWREEFPIYSQMVRSEDCLHNYYAEYLSTEDFMKLSAKQFIYSTPLIKRREKPRKSVLEKLLKNPSQISLVENEQGEIEIDEEIEYWDFANLVASENSILTNQSITSSKRILRFILDEAPDTDNYFREFFNISSNNDQQVEIRKSIWPGRLRDTQWVCVKSSSVDGDRPSYSNETPSSKNLAELIKDEAEFREVIKKENASAVLGILGISVADLLRSTLDSDEDKIQWDQAFTSILTSGMTASEAVNLINDPDTLSNFRERIERKRQITNNQKTGSNFEKVFQKIIKKYSPDLKIKRVHAGSDFIIEHDIVNNDKEEVFDIAGHYVELKATKRDYAAMTPKQVETAVEKPDRYSLIVLELQGETIEEENVLQNVYAISNVGDLLKDKFNGFQSVKRNELELQIHSDDVQIVQVDPEEIRFHIKQRMWREGKSLDMFIRHLLSK